MESTLVHQIEIGSEFCFDVLEGYAYFLLDGGDAKCGGAFFCVRALVHELLGGPVLLLFTKVSSHFVQIGEWMSSSVCRLADLTKSQLVGVLATMLGYLPT